MDTDLSAKNLSRYLEQNSVYSLLLILLQITIIYYNQERGNCFMNETFLSVHGVHEFGNLQIVIMTVFLDAI